jgi:uncharacterized protein YdeI (YjbR/CyaY-like superfamily)
MKNTSPKVDAYIDKSPDFAQPILNRIRQAFHKACPDIEEVMKWSTPFFEWQGLVGGMAAFKQHVRLIFWDAQKMKDPQRLFSGVGETDMGALKITKLADLPAERVLVAYVKEAIKLKEQAVQAPKPKRPKSAKAKKALRTVEVPAYFAAALAKNKKAKATFDKFSYSHKKEYVEWITEAKREETRQKRIATAIEWLTEGKPRNWKYMKC